MSLTLAGAVYSLARRTVAGEGWKEIQRERARRDYNAAVSTDGNIDRQKLYNYALKNSGSLASRLLEPGYCDEVFELLEDDGEDLVEYRNRFLEEYD